jgi:hypothetical protein
MNAPRKVGAHLGARFTEAVFTAVSRDWRTASALAHTAIVSTLRPLDAGETRLLTNGDVNPATGEPAAGTKQD